MSKFIRHRRGDCPVCNGARKDCRTSVDTQITFCRSGEANPSGYIYKGQDPNGFGIWVPDTGSNDDWRKEWERDREKRRQAEEKRLSRSLSPNTRNTGYRAILDQLELNSNDRELLSKRGDGWESVAAVAKSAETFHPVDSTLHLPGYNTNRQSLNNGAKGILFPVEDYQGRVIALRLYNPKASKDNGEAKYSWVSTNNEVLHLSTGELPLGVFYPSEKTNNSIYICEGVEIKPRLLAERLGAVVIGIPGASTFPSYYQQIKEILGYFDAQELILIPDAGAILNPSIRPGIERFTSQLDRLGVEFNALWWSQFEKSDLDGDEIEPEKLRNATVISVKELLGVKPSYPVFDFIKGVLNGLNIFKVGSNKGLIRDKSNAQAGLVPASEYDGHIVEFNPGEGAQIYEKAGRLGYRYILDQSPTGAGKTHTVSQLNPQHFYLNPDNAENTEFRQLIYCSQSHRNPNNAGIEDNFYEMVSRTTGYELDYDKLTPLKRPYRVKASEDTPSELRTKANCHWSDLFNQAYSAGHSTEGFCGACQYFDKCRVTNGDGYGYLSESNQFKKESRVHGHLKGLPVGSVDDNVILVIDEAETAEWVEIQTVAEKDVKAIFKAIKAYSESLYKQLLPLKDGLVDLFDEVSNPSPDYGWHYEDINLELPDGVLDLIPEIQQVEASLRPDAKELAEGKKPMYQAFLVNLIHVLSGKKRGSLSASNKSLAIHSINQRNLDHVNGAHCTIFQDATMSRFQLAKILGVEEKDILLIRQKVPQKHNLVINQYVGVGRLGNNRSQDEVNRAELWREYFAGRDIGWIDYKAHSREGDLIHGGDGRGSNAFQNKKEVGIMGIYRPNMGAVLSETEAILGKKLSFDSEEFKQFYGHKVASNVLQEVGRLRNNRRDEDKLTVHLIGDGDLSFLDEMGLNLQVIDATTIGLEYATIENRTKQRNLNVCLAYVKECGESALDALRQNSLADMLGITPQALCQWGKKLFSMEGDAPGEWFKRFKAAVMALVKPEPKEVDGERLEVIECLVNDIFPVIARVTCTANEFAKNFSEYMGIFSWDDILEALNRLSMNISARLLFRILRFAG